MKNIRHSSLIWVFLPIILFISFVLKITVFKPDPKNDNMAKLIDGRPHPPLVKVELNFGVNGPTKASKRVLSIEDAASLKYIESHGFGGYKDQYNCGALQPKDAIFVFADGSRYDAVLTVPNKPGHLRITYPINPWSWENIDDKQYFLELEPEKTKYLTEYLKRLNNDGVNMVEPSTD